MAVKQVTTCDSCGKQDDGDYRVTRSWINLMIDISPSVNREIVDNHKVYDFCSPDCAISVTRERIYTAFDKESHE